jgi:hypothetical protein
MGVSQRVSEGVYTPRFPPLASQAAVITVRLDPDRCNDPDIRRRASRTGIAQIASQPLVTPEHIKAICRPTHTRLARAVSLVCDGVEGVEMVGPWCPNGRPVVPTMVVLRWLPERFSGFTQLFQGTITRHRPRVGTRKNRISSGERIRERAMTWRCYRGVSYVRLAQRNCRSNWHKLRPAQ